jgi:glyoxylase-like metal-dependent hydrolase (beta-lactamase superfamily II)
MVGHVTAPAAAPLEALPGWVTLVRAPNPGPMTLDGTNTWVLRPPGAARTVVVDPGPLDEGHLAAVAAEGPVGLILATHSHPDHVEGLDRFRELCPDAAMIPLGWDNAMVLDASMAISVLGTPGHTADSTCFVVEVGGERVALTGDTILGRGTTVVAHPDGDLGDYLASLGRLSELKGVPVLPGHGPALSDCAEAAVFYLEHRRVRLAQVAAAREAGAVSAAEVVEKVYADVDRSLWPAAEWSVRAQLAYLDRESSAGPPQLDPP